MLAPSSLRSLISSPGHTNMLRFFPGGRRPCWRRPSCEALFLRRVTPTCSGFSCIAGGRVGAVLPAKPYFFAGRKAPTCSGFTHIAGGFVGVFLPAKPYFFAESRQHAPVFPGRSPAVLAPSFLLSLISSPGHANMLRFFPGGRRPCWRLPPGEALFLRRATPTCSGFSRIAAAHVGAVLPAKPYFFAGSRQHALFFPA